MGELPQVYIATPPNDCLFIWNLKNDETIVASLHMRVSKAHELGPTSLTRYCRSHIGAPNAFRMVPAKS